MKRAVASLIAVGTAALLAGCANINSQISTLKPVEGDAITGLNIAVNDVLLDRDVRVLVAPVCEYSAETYLCEGTTVSGAKIRAEADGAKPTTFTVKVGREEVFSGGIQDVLTKAGQR